MGGVSEGKSRSPTVKTLDFFGTLSLENNGSFASVRTKANGVAPFFNEGTPGADIHPRILVAAPTAPIVVKEFPDGFEQTNLEGTLTKLGVTELLVCGIQ